MIADMEREAEVMHPHDENTMLEHTTKLRRDLGYGTFGNIHDYLMLCKWSFFLTYVIFTHI